jgi:ABC-type nitrate/sulfonate/bicarbonate transport system permease component
VTAASPTGDVAASPLRMRSLRTPHLGGVIGVVLVLGGWTLLARTWLSERQGVPTPWAVLRQMGRDGWSFYQPHLQQTLSEALTGYVIGNGLALGCALLVLVVPFTERIIMQLAVASYCLPLVAVGPILSIAFTGDRPMSALAALSVFFTTLVGVLLGLRSADETSLDLVAAYGGGRWQQLRRVRLMAALPSTFAALKIAAPASLLGAIIGEYMGRVDSGLGVAMTVSQQSLQVSRTWGLALVAGAVAGLGYGITTLVARFVTPWARATTAGGSL